MVHSRKLLDTEPEKNKRGRNQKKTLIVEKVRYQKKVSMRGSLRGKREQGMLSGRESAREKNTMKKKRGRFGKVLTYKTARGRSGG